MADSDNYDAQTLKLKALSMNLEDLKNYKIQVEEAHKRQSEKRRVLSLEQEDRITHHTSLKYLHDLEMTSAKAGQENDNGFDKEDEEKRALQQVENTVFEKLTFHMDKYFTFVELNIKHSVKRIDNDDDKNAYAASTISAILVKCLKANFNNSESVESELGLDDDESFMNTFKITKKTQFSHLKKTAVLYWNLLDVEDQKKQENDEKVELEEEELSRKLDQSEKNGISQSHVSQSQVPFKQFEWLDDAGSVIADTDLIDKYVGIQQQKTSQDSQYFTVTLRKKKPKKQKVPHQGKHQSNAIKDKDKSQIDKGKSLHDKDQSQFGKEKDPNTDHLLNNTNLQINPAEPSKRSGTVREEASQLDVINSEDEDEDQAELIDDKQTQKLQNPLYADYVKIFKRLPLLRKYFVIDDEEVMQKGQGNKTIIKKGFVFDDNHCCMMFVLLLLILMNGIELMILNNTNIFITHYEQIQSLLNIQYNASSVQNVKWQDITKIDDLSAFLSDRQGMPYQLFDKTSLLRQNYEIIGAVRIRQLRTKSIPCLHPTRTDKQSQVTCVYETYNKQTASTKKIGQGTASWQIFTPIENLPITRKIQGLFGNYDASGYIFDVLKNDQKIEFYQDRFTTAILPSYFDITTFAQIVTINLRSMDDGVFIFIEFIVEYTSTGVLVSVPTIITYSPDIYGTHSSSPVSVYSIITSVPPNAPTDYAVGTILFITDLFKTILAIVFMIFLILGIKNNDSGQGFDIRYLISLTFIMNMFVLVSTFYSVIQSQLQAQAGLDVLALQKLQTYIDLGDAANQYNTLIMNLSINLCALMIRVTLFLSFSKSFEAMLYSIEHSYLQLMASFIVLGLVVFGFTFVSISIWGYYLKSFSSFQDAILSLLLLTMGQFDVSQIFQRGLNLAIPFLTSYYFLVYQYMFGIVAVIYIDAYRVTIIDRGVDGGVEDTWTLQDLKLWFFQWLPQSLYEKLEGKKKQISQV